MSTYPPPPPENPGGATPYGGAPGPGRPAPQYDPNAPQYDPNAPQYDPNAPQYGQQQYGQQPPYDPNAPQYGQIPPQGAPYGDPNAPWSFAPPPPRSRKGLKIGLSIGGAVILIVGGVIGYAVFNVTKSTGEYKLVPPQTFQGMTRDDSSAMAKSEAGAMADASGKAGLTPVVTIYNSSSGSPGLLFEGEYGDTLGASLGVSQFWTKITAAGQATVSDKTDEPAGSLGGSMQCAIVTIQGTTVPTCVWGDNSSVTAIMDFSVASSGSSGGDSSSEISAVDAKTLALRSVAEVKK
ncbi:hypothetical protein [Streptacidiphilus sp. P02-A3a]|uniref:hypothetical protein n=1 Tax=Streptacidiphilus sp. P02-A3a TaxID=2704468 RepID=UPI0015FDE9A1|nr:hypothetical protein [Streptacidiphilus sp. P02-A3a]QMU68130.1 hypothetical protein GXP74_07745 [Streptacidiphilus sp. P02-A3a]